MNKTIPVLLALIIIIGLVYTFGMNKEMVNDQQGSGQLPTGENTSTSTNNNGVDSGSAIVEMNANGTIATVDSSQIAVDGPIIVTVNIEGGAQVTIAIPSMGINLCPAKANIADASTLKAGDRIEARGQVTADGSIVPCEYASHYLRVVAQ